LNWSAIRQVLSQPSEEHFHRCCELLSAPDTPDFQEALFYVQGHLDEWPDSLRTFPPMTWKELSAQPEDWAPFHLATTLNLTSQRMGLKGAKLLAHSPQFKHLRSLTLNASLTNKQFEEIASSKTLIQLQTLNMQRNNLGNEGLKALCRDSVVFPLTSLDYSWNYPDNPGLLALETAPFTENLTSLNLSSSSLGLKKVRALCKAPLVSLQHLNLAYNDLSNKAFSHIVEQGQFASLKSLDLTYNTLQKGAVRLLASDEKLQTLESLGFGSQKLDDRGLRLLLKNLPHLKALNLHWNTLTHKGLRFLLKYSNLSALHTLNWSRNNLGDSGIKQLANTEEAISLRHLDLSWNGITDKGAQWILESPVFANLDYINLSSNPLSKKMKAAIAAHVPKTDFDFYPKILPD
jgi:Ran GTPase-activating protein (RanGAP) involved in mRNA processing and transport